MGVEYNHHQQRVGGMSERPYVGEEHEGGGKTNFAKFRNHFPAGQGPMIYPILMIIAGWAFNGPKKPIKRGKLFSVYALLLYCVADKAWIYWK